MLENSDNAGKHRDENNRRSNFNFHIQLSEKKEDLLKQNRDANNKILSDINTELAKLRKKLGLEGDLSDGESSC